jgi:hypothetical protein
MRSHTRTCSRYGCDCEGADVIEAMERWRDALAATRIMDAMGVKE